MQNQHVVSCPPCGENVGLPTKRGCFNKRTSLTTSHSVIPCTTAPSSSHSVSVRDIGAASALYPALQTCGMTKRSVRGFTLIELLVVVLIIAILAAVALPQYNKAVEKSKISEGLTLLKSVGQAAQAYYLETGNMPWSFDALNIDVPFEGTITDSGSTIQHLLMGDSFIGQKTSNDWGIALLPSKKQVMVFRMNGKYSYKNSLRSGFLFVIKSDAVSNKNLPAGTIGCFTPTAGSDYCSSLLGISKDPISISGYKWYSMS